MAVAPITVIPRSRSAAQSSISGSGVECAGDVVGEEHLDAGSQRSCEGEPLYLSAGEPDATVPDQGVLPTGVLDVASQPGGRDRVVESPPMAQQDVVGEAAGQHPRHLGVVGATRREERLRVGDLPTVPEQYAECSIRPASAERVGWTLAGADLPDQEHQFAGLHGEVHAG